MAGAGQLFGDLVGGDQQDGADDGVEQAHGCGQTIVGLGHAHAVHIGVDHIGKLVVSGAVQQQELVGAHAEHRAHAQNQHHDDHGGDAGDGHVEQLLPLAGAVHRGRFIQFLVHRAQGGQVDDGAIPQALPHILQNVNEPEVLLLVDEVHAFPRRRCWRSARRWGRRPRRSP